MNTKTLEERIEIFNTLTNLHHQYIIGEVTQEFNIRVDIENFLKSLTQILTVRNEEAWEHLNFAGTCFLLNMDYDTNENGQMTMEFDCMDWDQICQWVRLVRYQLFKEEYNYDAEMLELVVNNPDWKDNTDELTQFVQAEKKDFARFKNGIHKDFIYENFPLPIINCIT